MSPETRKYLLEYEDKLRESVRTNRIVSMAYDIGLQKDLSLEQVALIALPYLLERIKALEEHTQFSISGVNRV